MKQEHRGYQIVEPPIYATLNWNMDLIVSCLEVIRQKLPEKFNQFPSSLEYDLVSLETPHGSPYPVIGIHTKQEKDFENFLFELVENWITDIDVEKLKQESKELEIITWKELKAIGHYPLR